jgi:hypothetical protein
VERREQVSLEKKKELISVKFKGRIHVEVPY